MNKKILIGIVMSLLLIGAIGLSYSFFSTSIKGIGKQNTVTTGTLKLQYIDGEGVSFLHAYPGITVTKVVGVKNTGTLSTTYNLIYKDLINEIENNELVVSYTCTSYMDYIDSTNKGTKIGTCGEITDQVVPYSETKIDEMMSQNIAIMSGITHEYAITFTFIKKVELQNYNQGKKFGTSINITEGSETPEIYMLLGTLVDNNNNPITNATIEIHSEVKNGITDNEGLFRIAEVKTGEHEFKVKNSNNEYIIEDTIKILNSRNASSVDGKEITINNNSDKIYLKIKTNNGKISNINIMDKSTLYERILSDNNSGQSDENINFLFTSEGKITDLEGNEFVDNTQITNGLYYTSDLTLTEDYNKDGEGDRVYYYRGAVTNNNVRFGGYCWKIVRTNEDGSVRLRYNGTYENGTCPVNGTPVNINESNNWYQFNAEWESQKHNEYIWESGDGESDAKTQIDAWYISSGLESYADQIANVPYCADKSNPVNDIFGNEFYGATSRFFDIPNLTINMNAKPTYKCQDVEDKHTVSGDNWGGNGKLSKPIGMLTADEIVYAGITTGANESNYLRMNDWYWLISPWCWNAGISGRTNPLCNAPDGQTAAVGFYVDSSGTIGGYGVDASTALAPVISLNANVLVEPIGTGSYTNPYVVEK